jgi:general secretion pathway protein C
LHAVRFVTGAGCLAALFLATHALVGMATWVFWTDVEPVAVVADQPGERKTKTAFVGKGNEPSTRVSLDYNVFCPECTDAAAELEFATAAGGRPGSGESVADASAIDGSMRETSLPLVLVATMEAVPPGVSAATIALDEGPTGLYAEGDEVLDGVEIVLVDTGIVILENAGRREFLRLATAEEIQKKRTERESEPDEKKDTPQPKKNPNEIDGAAEAIACEGSRCTIDRAFLERMMSNPAALARQARATPYSRDGLEGLRIFGVGKGTIPQMLGLRTGDVITALDGKPLGSMDDALQMVERLRSASGVEIGYTRNQAGTRTQMQLQLEVR